MGFYLNNHFEGKKLAIRIQMIEKQKYFTNLTELIFYLMKLVEIFWFMIFR